MLAEFASMDYMHETYLAQLHTRFCKTRPLTSGIALVVRKQIFYDVGGFRNVIYEDLDFTWRAFRLGNSYKLLDEVIHTQAPASIRKWFTQRKRWSLGLAEWFFENYKHLPKTAKSSRGLFLPWMLLLLPVLMMIIANYLVFQVRFDNAGLLQPAFLLSEVLGLEQYSYLAQSHSQAIKTTLTYFVSLSICVLWSFKLRSLGYTLSWDVFFLYYIAYAPTVLLMYAYGFLTVGIGKQYKLSDWKA